MSNYLSYRDGGKTNEQGLFQWLGRLFTKGHPINDTATSLQVVQRGAGANMSVDISVGDVNIADTSYDYWAFTDAIVNKSVTASDPTNPRNDIVVAYVDKSVVSSASNNNPNALNFAVVAGTPAGSPADPSGSTIQSAVGAGNPYISLARIALPANAGSVVTAYITDLRLSIAFKGKLYGGASNTVGHTVPNIADDIVALLAATQTLTNKTIASNNNTFSLVTSTQANAGTAGGTFTYINFGGVKFLWCMSATGLSAGASALSYTFTLPVSFFTTITTVVATPNTLTGHSEQYATADGVSASSITIKLVSPGGAATAGIGLFVIGT